MDEAFNGFLDMSVESPESLGDGSYKKFQERVREKMAEDPFDHQMKKDEKVRNNTSKQRPYNDHNIQITLQER